MSKGSIEVFKRPIVIRNRCSYPLAAFIVLIHLVWLSSISGAWQLTLKPAGDQDTISKGLRKTKEPAQAGIKDAQQSKFLRLIVADFRNRTKNTTQSALLTTTATVLFENRLSEIPGLEVVPQREWQPQLGNVGMINFLINPYYYLQKLLVQQKVTAVASGELLSFTERCKSGGYLLVGVRQMEYSATFSFTILDLITNMVLFSHSSSTVTVEKSVGFKRSEVRLSVPAAQKIVKPVLDSALLELSNLVTTKLRSRRNETR